MDDTEWISYRIGDQVYQFAPLPADAVRQVMERWGPLLEVLRVPHRTAADIGAALAVIGLASRDAALVQAMNDLSVCLYELMLSYAECAVLLSQDQYNESVSPISSSSRT